MSFPSINGAAINGEEGGDVAITPAGLDAVRTPLGVPTAYAVGSYAGARPVEIGDVEARVVVLVPGLDAVSSGTAIAVYDALITPAGLDAVTPGVAAVAGVYVAPGSYPVELGNHRIRQGIDVEITPAGMDAVRSGLHLVVRGMPPADGVYPAAGARPVEMGGGIVRPGTIAAVAPGARPVEVGQPGTQVAGIAPGAYPVEVGSVGAPRTAVSAPGARPVELGQPSAQISITVGGLDPVRGGTHAVQLGGADFPCPGAYPVELGDFGTPPRVTARAPQHFPVQLGAHTIQREAAC